MLNKKKILFTIGSFEFGGAELHLATLLPKLKEIGYNVTLLSLSDKGNLKKVFLKNNISLILPFIKNVNEEKFFYKFVVFINLLFSFFYILLFSLKNRDAILHFFLPDSYIIGGLAGVITFHKKMIMSRRSLNNYQKRNNKFLIYLELLLHKKMTAIVGNSKKVIDQLNRIENVSRDKLYLIYNGIDLSKYSKKKSEVFRRSLNISQGVVVIANVANLIKYKGHFDLLKACTLIKSKNWILLIIGNDNQNMKISLLKFIKENKLGDNVRFLGQIDDVIKILKICDVGVLTSHEEGFSNAILEYMASSLPLVVTDIGGNREAVKNETNGYLVNVGDIDNIAKKLNILISDKKKRQEFGKNHIKLFLITFC